MSATPVIPGQAYKVKTASYTQVVLAKNPIDALLIVLEQA